MGGTFFSCTVQAEVFPYMQRRLMTRRHPPRGLLQRGFTILEIVIVFILLAGLMAFVIPKIYQQTTRAQASDAKLRLTALTGQIELYKLENGKYPDSLDALVKAPAGSDSSRWNGPYVKPEELKDAWGNPYKYQVPGTNKPYDLVSLGADGREGGEGENKDISN
jgi:general secretion pathway protein G